MTYSCKWWSVSAAGLATAWLVIGCQDKLAYDRFAQIQQDASTRVEVVALIGEPDEELGDQWFYERPDKHLMVLVRFDERGVVSRKQWADADAGVWEDTDSPAPDRPETP